MKLPKEEWVVRNERMGMYLTWTVPKALTPDGEEDRIMPTFSRGQAAAVAAAMTTPSLTWIAVKVAADMRQLGG